MQKMTDDPPIHTGDDQKPLPTRKPLTYGRWRKVFKVVVPLLILGSGIALASYIHKTGPKTIKKPPHKMAPLVITQTVRRGGERIILRAMGSVIPARQMQLRSRVSGEVIEIQPDFIEGGFFKKDEKILQIDQEDYKLAVARKQSQVVSAGYELKLEMGRQDVAKREWELLNQGRPAKALDLELSLRKPHLEKAQADLAAAEADLDQAKLDLDRTTVRAPFNAVIRTKNVEQGSQVSSQDPLAELVGTDEYRIQVSVPVDRLEWIAFPLKPGDAGSKVHILHGKNRKRTGVVIKLLSDLEEEGRMARVLVSVNDPLDLRTQKTKRPPLLIGEYVRVEIEGRKIDNVFSIPRTALRENAKVWITDDDSRLSIRNVDVVWRDMKNVLLKSGLEDGERVIVSDIAAPVEGMAVRAALASEAATDKRSGKKGH